MSNRDKLAKFVAGHKAIAASKPPAEAAKHLYQWAEWLNEQLPKLALSDALPPHLKGLDAFDLANARDDLSAAAVAYEKAA